MLQSRTENRQRNSVFSVYEWDENVADLLVKKFDGSTMEWLEMVANGAGNHAQRRRVETAVGGI